MEALIDEALLPELLKLFYSRVRADALIGPLFNEVVEDWPGHLARLEDFWSSVMLTSGRYKGNPMALHLQLTPRLSAPMFDRWLAIWRGTSAEMMPPDAAAALQAKAGRIAESLQLALKLHDPAGRKAMLEEPASRPYRSTPVFDSETLPEALRLAHNTKAGTWGLIRVLEGRLLYRLEESGEEMILDPTRPGLVRPQERHHVEPLGPMRMRVDFYDHEPKLA
jgi:truncated hemoglobin YjbI/tellurite resistance-related uncharacterized protein